jgi:hypothetical protein
MAKSIMPAGVPGQRKPPMVLAALLLCAALTPGWVLAQQPTLGLFEPIEQTAVPQPAASAQPIMQSASEPVVRPTAPQFVLVGTSRFGDQHRARLRTPGGEVVVVDLNESAVSVIPGFPGFEIEEASDRLLVVRHPSNVACFAAPEQGVNCTASHVSALQLKTAQAIQPAPSANRAARPDSGTQIMSVSVQDQADDGSTEGNPFAAALRAARERGEVDPATIRAEAERFRPRRIDPSEVPPGSRLVRTPFGDRIISDQQ